MIQKIGASEWPRQGPLSRLLRSRSLATIRSTPIFPNSRDQHRGKPEEAGEGRSMAARVDKNLICLCGVNMAVPGKSGPPQNLFDAILP